jgi:hypothetical protein
MTRSPLILAAVLGVLALGACGESDDGGGSAGSGSSAGDKAFEGALNFAKCMREHGVDFPDPTRDANGRVKLVAKATKGTEPKMKAAQEACQKHLQAGGAREIDPETKAKAQDALLNFARCMRGEGIDMDDPQVGGGGGLLFRQGGRGVDPESPKYKAAEKVCRHHLAEIEQLRKGESR